MKIKNKKIFYGLGSLTAIAPLPIAGFNLEDSKKSDVDRLQSQEQPPEFVFKQIPGLPNKINNVLVTKSNKILLGTDIGLWASTDNGKTFNEICPRFFSQQPVFTLCQIPNGKIFLGCCYSFFISNDDGVTFGGQVDNSMFQENPEIVDIYNSIDQHLFFSANWDGLYESTDGGVTFKDLPQAKGDRNDWPIDWVYQTIDGKIFIGSNDVGLTVSTNNGNHFDRVGGALINDKVKNVTTMYQSSTGKVFLGTKSNGLYQSKDNGDNFLKMTTWPLPDSVGINLICSAPSGGVLIATKGGGLWKSNDNGETFIEANPQFWSGKSILSISTSSDGKIYVGTDSGLWVSFVGISYSIQQGANNIDAVINDERNIISNQPIGILITSPIVKVDIDGKDYDITPNVPFNQTITSEKHNFILTYNDGTKYSFIIWIKNLVNIDPTDFTVDNAYALEQYEGYLNSDENNSVQVISVMGNSGQPSLYINLNSSDKTIDYSKSYYQQLDNSFSPQGDKVQLQTDKTTINISGLYLLKITDGVGNAASYYVQIGGTVDVIPKSFYANDKFTVEQGVDIRQNIAVDGKNFDYITNGNITYFCNDKKVDEIKISQLGGITDDIKSGIYGFSRIFQINDSATQYEITIFYNGTQLKKYDIMLVPKTINENDAFNVESNHGNAYKGNWRKRVLNVISFLDVNGIAKTSIDLNLDSNQINLTGKSYYQKIDILNASTVITTTTIATTNATISGAGMYEVHLVDLFGFENVYYAQIGGKKDIIPPINSDDHNSTSTTWKVLLITISTIAVAILFIGLFIRYRPRRAKSITSVKAKKGIISDKELEEMQKEEQTIVA